MLAQAARNEPLAAAVVAGGSGAVAILYDGDDILRETRSEGTTYTYVHGPGIDEPLAREDQAGNRTYYHADGLGSVVRMTDATGSVVASYSYDAWGNPEGAVPEGYGFTGREHDAETSLMYYRARYYSPRDGRFLSEDPIGFAGGINVYAYVGNNPGVRIDPFGLDWLESFDRWVSETLDPVFLGLGGLEDLSQVFVRHEHNENDLVMWHIQRAREAHRDSMVIVTCGVSARIRMRDLPRFREIRDHARRHSNLDWREYYREALQNVETGRRFAVRHEGRTKNAYVTRTGPDSFTFTSTSQDGRAILTHLYDVSTQYLRNKGITLPEGF